MFVQQLGIGVLVGVVLGYLLSLAVARVRLEEGLYALLIQSAGPLFVALWSLVRPALVARPAVPPRIWNT